MNTFVLFCDSRVISQYFKTWFCLLSILDTEGSQASQKASQKVRELKMSPQCVRC